MNVDLLVGSQSEYAAPTVSVSSATDNMFIYASVEIGLRKLFPQFASYSILLSVMKGVNKCKIFKLAFLERVLGPLWNRGSCFALQRNNGDSRHLNIIEFNNVRTA